MHPVTGGVEITDTGQTISYNEGPVGACLSVDPNTMRCFDVNLASFKLADGNDHFHNFTIVTTYAYGNDGDDTFQGDVVFGGDHFFGENGKDWLMGGSGFDELEGGPGDDKVYGSFGNDVVFGGPGDDYVSGGSGDDWTVMDTGDDEVRGEAGNDRMSYRNHAAVKVTLDGQANDGAPGERDNVHGSWEIVEGSYGDDVLIGNDQANTLDGLSGNDTLKGRGGDDTLDAMAGVGQKIWGGAGEHDICTGYDLVVWEDCEH
jgi:Ca2+-binding RTX toxin-like protein